MPYNLHIIKQSDYIQLDGEGKVDLKRSQEALSHLATQCIDRGIECALLDVRGINSEMSVADLYSLAKMFHQTGFSTRHRLAILHKYNSGQRAEMFAMFASDRGWNVDAFDSYEDAMEWFSTKLPVEWGRSMLESVAISLCLFISLLAGLEFGRWLRLRRGPVQGDAGASSEADGVVFAMLGLMIAFTFTAAASRFEERQKLIAQQANALGTAWLRVDLLLEADREPVRKYMREWLKLEVEVTPLVANDPVQFDAHLKAAAHLQDQAWSAVVAAIDRHPKPPYAGMVIPPFNDWIDLTSARVELGNRGVPPMVMPTLGLLSITAAVLAGFSMGKRPQRSLMHMLLFSGAITLAIFVIIDLNHPRSGLIRVDSADHAMQELYATMTAAAPTTGEVKP